MSLEKSNFGVNFKKKIPVFFKKISESLIFFQNVLSLSWFHEMLQLISNNNDQKSPKSNRKPIRVNLLKIICNTITTWEFFLYKSHQLQLFNKKLSRAVRAQDSSFFLYSLSLSIKPLKSNRQSILKKKTMTPSFLSQLSWSPPSLPFLEKERREKVEKQDSVVVLQTKISLFFFFSIP